MVLAMESVGVRVERQHHEVATAGQAEIDMFRQPLLEMGDWLMWYKYCVKNVARRNGKTATFMPKPIFGDNGSGMHCHQSFWKNERPLFAGDGYAGMSEMAMHYIGGILKHAPALCALTNPTTNSYRRLVPGYEAPVNLAYSSRNRSASIRIPMYSSSPKARRIEVRFPDPSCNPYLAFSAMMMAGLDGVQRKLDPGDPLDKDIYSLSPEELKDVPHVPGSLDVAGPGGDRTLPDRAAAAVREGCIGETIAAMMVRAQLEVARDEQVRAALARIAHDEERHAALSWRFVRWAIDRGGDDVRRAVAAAFAAGCCEARASLPGEAGHRGAEWGRHGRLESDDERRLTTTALDEVIGPCARALLSPAA